MLRQTALIISLMLILVVLAAMQIEGEETLCTDTYTVQADDWLSKIAVRFYDDAFAYADIVRATNIVATMDESFSRIDNPNALEVGQKLCIPLDKHFILAHIAIPKAPPKIPRSDITFPNTALNPQKVPRFTTPTPPQIKINEDNASLSQANANNFQQLPVTQTASSDQAHPPPSSGAQVYIENQFSDEIHVDIGGQSIQILSKEQQSINLEAGQYTYSIGAPNGWGANGTLDVGLYEAWLFHFKYIIYPNFFRVPRSPYLP